MNRPRLRGRYELSLSFSLQAAVRTRAVAVSFPRRSPKPSKHRHPDEGCAVRPASRPTVRSGLLACLFQASFTWFCDWHPVHPGDGCTISSSGVEHGLRGWTRSGKGREGSVRQREMQGDSHLPRARRRSWSLWRGCRGCVCMQTQLQLKDVVETEPLSTGPVMFQASIL